MICKVSPPYNPLTPLQNGVHLSVQLIIHNGYRPATIPSGLGFLLAQVLRITLDIVYLFRQDSSKQEDG